MMGARGGLGDARVIAELESLLGKRPDKKNRAVRWSDLEAFRKSIIKAGGAGTLDGVAPDGDGAVIPSVPGTTGERLAERLRLAEREIEAAEREAGAAREAAQNAMSALTNAGTVYRAANIVTLPDGSRTAGIEAFVWDDEGNGTGSAVLLHGDQVMAPGTLSANTLVAGFGNNLLQNTRFYDGMLHWFKGGNGEVTGAVREAGQSYAHPSFRTLMLYQNGTSSSESFIEYLVQQEGTTTRIVGAPCQPEKWYGASVYLCPLRCAGVIEIRFFDAAGQLIDGAQRATSWADRASSSTIPDLWDRAFVKAQAPAGAAYVSIRIRKRGTNAGSPNSYLFIWKPMVEETHAAATAPGAYASGETSLMTGDMIYSRTILGRHLIADEAVITGTAQMGRAVVGTLAIGENEVTISGSQTLDNSIRGNDGWQAASFLSYTLTQAGAVTIEWNASQGYDNLNKQPIGFRLIIDGVVSWSVGGGGQRIETDFLSMSWKRYLGAGAHTIAVEWFGAHSVILYSRTLIVDGSMR